MRGEHLSYSITISCGSGSSPHARGALRDTLNRFNGEGIIPACAGSTARRRCRKGVCQDHPRMRGEH